MVDEGYNENDSDNVGGATRHEISIYVLLFATLLAIVLILSKELRKRTVLSSYFPEAAMIILVGMSISFFVEVFILVEEEIETGEDPELEEKIWATSLLSFQPDIFFIALLPPILFNSGYQLQREIFFRHIIPISLFACFGTIFSTLTAAFTLYGIQQLTPGGFNGNFDPSLPELLAFGALIAATDCVGTLSIFEAKKVDPHMFYVVFGESALNDAIALVLFKTFIDFLGFDLGEDASRLRLILQLLKDFTIQVTCSPLLGVSCSYFSAFVFKKLEMHEQKGLELALYLLIIYIPYLIAEYLELSGIVTIFFCGISAKRYIEPNLSKETSSNSNTIFKAAAYLTETCIFLEMGLSVFALSSSFEWDFIGYSILAACLGRAVSIYPLSLFWNFSLGKIQYIPIDRPDVAIANPTTSSAVDDNFDAVSYYSACEDNVSMDASVAHSIPRTTSYDNTTVSQSYNIANRTYKATRKTPITREDLIIPSNMMHVLWFAGIRGAVAYACAREFPDVNGNKSELIAATMAIILLTTFVMGGMTPLVLNAFDVKVNVDEEEYLAEWKKRKIPENFIQQFERTLYRLAVSNGSGKGQLPNANPSPPPQIDEGNIRQPPHHTDSGGDVPQRAVFVPKVWHHSESEPAFFRFNHNNLFPESPSDGCLFHIPDNTANANRNHQRQISDVSNPPPFAYNNNYNMAHCSTSSLDGCHFPPATNHHYNRHQFPGAAVPPPTHFTNNNYSMSQCSRSLSDDCLFPPPPNRMTGHRQRHRTSDPSYPPNSSFTNHYNYHHNNRMHNPGYNANAATNMSGINEASFSSLEEQPDFLSTEPEELYRKRRRSLETSPQNKNSVPVSQNNATRGDEQHKTPPNKNNVALSRNNGDGQHSSPQTAEGPILSPTTSEILDETTPLLLGSTPATTKVGKSSPQAAE